MRILYIASVRIPNEKASGLAIMRQCEAFAREGAEVTLMVPTRKNHITEDPFTYYGISPSFRIKTFRSVDFYEVFGRIGFYCALVSQMFSVFFLLKREGKNYNRIYTRDPWMFVLPAYFGSLKIACIELHKTYRSRFIAHVLRKTRSLITISEGLKEFAREKTGRTDIRVEPSGVNVEQFVHTDTKEHLRTKYGIPKESIVISYVGKITTMGEEKGVDDIVRSFAELHERVPHTYLCIVGAEGNETRELWSVAHSVGVTETSCMILSLDQRRFAEYLVLSDVVVMNYPDTTHYRTSMSPTKLVAAMGAGKVIVASDLPSVRELLKADMGFFVEPGNRAALIVGMMRAVLLTPDEKDALGERVRAAAGQYTWTARAQRILKLIA